MQTKPALRLLAVTLILTVMLSTLALPARTQERGVGLSKKGRYQALVIGNNEYRSVPRLKTAETDAREVEAALRSQYGFQTRLLLNATRQQIISALNAYRRELDAESNLLIYYAGHGVNDKEIDKAYWLPVDAELNDNANWISADDITSNIRGISARHVLIVSDSCYSGTLTRGLTEPSFSEPAMRQRYLEKMMLGRSRTLMASGGNEPVADGGGGGKHSVFANALLRGLEQMEQDEFTAAELFRNYVEVRVAGGMDQTPEYNPLRNSGHESGDFVFVRVKAEGKRVEATAKPPAAAPPPPTVDSAAVELAFWNSIQNYADPEDFKEYLAKYPNGQFAGVARRRVAALTAQPAQPAPTSSAGDSNKGGAAPDAGRSAPAGAIPAAATARTPATARVARNFEYPTLTLDAVGKLKTRESRSATYYAEDLGGGVLLEMVEIPGGSFSMGSTDADVRAAFADNTRYNKDARLEWFTNETPQHQVTLKGFLIAKHEVTQAQYRAVMGANPSYFKGDNLPVEQVSWNDAVEFCRRLSAKTGREYRLPSEAEWEYAARAGTTTPFAFGETITPELVNYDGNHPYAGGPKGAYRAKTMPVGSGGAANGFGLYDMHGNVWEWCLDYWHENYGGRASGAPSDGSAWLSGGDPSRRVRRGGSWSHDANYQRSANRGRYAPANRNSNVGFRVVTMART